MLKVNETRKRSILKAVSFRILEITVTTLALHFWFKQGWSSSVGGAVALETMCLLLHFLFERIWNKTDYGREVL